MRIDWASALEGFRLDLPRLSLLFTDFIVLTVSAMEGARLDRADDPERPAPNLAARAGDIGGLCGPDDTRGKGEKVPVREGGFDFFGDGFFGASSGV